MRDIVGQMFDARCVKELFRPQKLFNKKSLRTVFDRLAHASIMKLNSSAMDKLYDLMIMAVKYQVSLFMLYKYHNSFLSSGIAVSES